MFRISLDPKHNYAIFISLRVMSVSLDLIAYLLTKSLKFKNELMKYAIKTSNVYRLR